MHNYGEPDTERSRSVLNFCLLHSSASLSVQLIGLFGVDSMIEFANKTKINRVVNSFAMQECPFPLEVVDDAVKVIATPAPTKRLPKIEETNVSLSTSRVET